MSSPLQLITPTQRKKNNFLFLCFHELSEENMYASFAQKTFPIVSSLCGFSVGHTSVAHCTWRQQRLHANSSAVLFRHVC